MSSPDPHTAPARPDLGFLRHRAQVRPTPSSPALSNFLAGRDPDHHHHQTAAPAPVTAAPAAPAAASASLDLSAPVPPPSEPARVVSSSLDLTTSPPRPPVVATAPSRRLPGPVRAETGRQSILTPISPVVTLNRLQSGIGTLVIEAACSDEVGDLRLGAAYQLRSGHASTVQHAGGSRSGPRDARRPVIVGQREQYERISLDLRQSREIERVAVYAFSESSTQLHWGGTLIVSTFGGAKIELPLELGDTGAVAMLISLYNVGGEFVIRSEMELFAGSIRDACRAYGYDRITWLDERTPVQ